MMLLSIYAGGRESYLQALKKKLQILIEKINKDQSLTPMEKFEARQQALKSVQKNASDSFRNCY